jgi:hypothetical protein
MKKLFTIALVCAAAMTATTFTSCDKEDNTVDLAQLAGKWHEIGIIGSTDNYTFDRDGNYELSIASTTHLPIRQEGTYEVSGGNTLTLHHGEAREQYLLLEINPTAMRWRGAHGEQTFARFTD